MSGLGCTNYMKAARVTTYSDLRDAAQKLKAHSSNVASLLELSSLASRNTAVADPSQSAPFQPAQAVSPRVQRKASCAGGCPSGFIWNPELLAERTGGRGNVGRSRGRRNTSPRTHPAEQ
jgi:hypothetical protein